MSREFTVLNKEISLLNYIYYGMKTDNQIRHLKNNGRHLKGSILSGCRSNSLEILVFSSYFFEKNKPYHEAGINARKIITIIRTHSGQKIRRRCVAQRVLAYTRRTSDRVFAASKVFCTEFSELPLRGFVLNTV